MRRTTWMIAAALMVAGPARAQPADPARRLAMEQTARDVAARNLRAELAAARVDDPSLADARQLAGPRWLDDATCQVRLTLARDDAGDNDGRVFVATGTVVDPAALADVRPTNPPPAWRAVGDRARREALRRAHDDARQSVGRTLASVPIPAAAAAEMEAYLAGRPVTRVRFVEERGEPVAEVELAADAAGLAGHLRTSAAPGVGQAAARLETMEVSAVGRAVAATDGSAAYSPADNLNPRRSDAPAWAGRTLVARGESGPAATRLIAARRAESAAADALAAQLADLPLAGTTVGDLARRDRRVADAIDDALNEARIIAADYDRRGGVLVKAELPAAALWNILSR